MGEKVIEFVDVVKRFDGRAVLDGLSFAVERGEVFTVLGPSGTGKSVTLKHIVGLEEPDSGEVRVADARVGYLFQSGALIAWKTVWENVALPLVETTRLPDAEIERRVASALEAVGLSDAADRYPAELSGGMQKRAGLARAIVRDAEIVLYDEPTSGLDPVTSAVIERLIVDLNRSRGVTSVVVTHDLAMAARTSSRIMLIKDGKSVACLPPDEFMRCGKREVAEFVGAAKGEET